MRNAVGVVNIYYDIEWFLLHKNCSVLLVLFSVSHIEVWMILVSSLNCYFLYIWAIFNQNIQTYDRSAIKIDEGEMFQDNLIHRLSYFTRKKSTETRTDFLKRFIMGYVDIIRNSLEMPLAIFHRYHWSVLQ